MTSRPQLSRQAGRPPPRRPARHALQGKHECGQDKGYYYRAWRASLAGPVVLPAGGAGGGGVEPQTLVAPDASKLREVYILRDLHTRLISVSFPSIPNVTMVPKDMPKGTFCCYESI